MKQRVRPLLLFKKKSAVAQRVTSGMRAIANRQQSTTLGAFRAVSISAAVGSNIVRVCFNEPPVATNYATGVTITVTPDGSARTISLTAVDKNCVEYTISGAALLEGDQITWTYDADAVGADYTGGRSGEALEDSSLNFTIPSPPVTVDAWATESSPGNWKTELGDTWILETSAATFVTFLGAIVTFNGIGVTFV